MATKPPPVWHYVPFAGNHSSDASKYVDSLRAAIKSWTDAQVTEDPAGARYLDEDAVRCDLAGALARSLEWDGLMICHELKLISRWRCNFELAAAIQRWSCSLKTRVVAEWKRRHGLKDGRTAA